MASAGLAIGSFMQGVEGGLRLGAGLRDRDDRKAERERLIKLDEEDRALKLEDRKIAQQDKARLREQEDYTIGRQKAADSREDSIRGAYSDAVAATDAAIAGQGLRPATPAAAAIAGAPTPGAQPAAPATANAADGQALAASPAGQSLAAAKGGAPDQRPDTFVEMYARVGAPKIVRAYLEAGEPDKAQAFQTWIDTEGAKRGMKSWANATHAATLGDDKAFVHHMSEAFNNQDYFGDGYEVIEKKSGLTKGPQGNIIGAKMTFKGPDGVEFVKEYSGMDDLYRAAVQFMAPEKVFEYGIEQVKLADAAALKAAEEERGLRNKRAEKDYDHKLGMEKSMFDSALRMDEIKAKLPTADEAFRKKVNDTWATMLKADGGFGKFSKMGTDEQLAEAVKAVQAVGGLTTAAPAGDGAAPAAMPPVWRSSTTGPGTPR